MKHYSYQFSNGENFTMTRIEAHRYAHRKKINIVSGPNYVEAKKQKSFDGWGLHDSLGVVFRGPQHYRSYLKEHGLEEAGMGDHPQYKDFDPPIWTEELVRKAIKEHGIDIGSVMADALLSGELNYPE